MAWCVCAEALLRRLSAAAASGRAGGAQFWAAWARLGLSQPLCPHPPFSLLPPLPAAAGLCTRAVTLTVASMLCHGESRRRRLRADAVQVIVVALGRAPVVAASWRCAGRCPNLRLPTFLGFPLHVLPSSPTFFVMSDSVSGATKRIGDPSGGSYRWVRLTSGYQALIEILVIMPREYIRPDTIEEAVQTVIPYLEDTSSTAHTAIYFDGWFGLAASAVLRAIAQDPPPPLLKKFDKIIHVDCSRWKSRRAFQRTIAQELKLPQRVMDAFDREDEEDDFKGVDESSRAKIQHVGAEIYRAVQDHHKKMFVFHNGSDNTIDLNDFDIPLSVWGTRVLWTFRGRLRLSPGIMDKLFKLEQICEAKMFAPRLETIWVRGCWGLRRLPAVSRGSRPAPVVDCEKDWWEKLEWDGLEAGHDPSLFQPRHSAHYKKPLPRGSVLW
ncbi:hypothetical protein ZWY2020_046408 [Hordeum vulgare]|nr:hypothetical protein ZWY2020_046408 [Hordeum vulgare]